MGTSDDVERIAAPLLQAAGLELVDVEIRSGNIVVTVDREGGIDLDTLASMSKAISAAIDREGVGPSSRYELEVSSPGLERRLAPARALPPVRRPPDLNSDLARSRRRAQDRGRARLRGRQRHRRDGARAARWPPTPRLWRHRKSPHGLRLEGGFGQHRLADVPAVSAAPRTKASRAVEELDSAPERDGGQGMSSTEFDPLPPGGAPADRRGEGHCRRHFVRRARQRARGCLQAPSAGC